MNFLKTLILTALFFSSLNANIEHYFKKAEGKSDHHRMRNIDFIYIINLDQRPEKFADCMARLAPYDIYPYRFSAVNGWELSLETINKVGVKFQQGMRNDFWGTSYFPEDNGLPYYEVIQHPGQTYFCHRMSQGAIGITLSHLSVLQDAYDSGYETIWVMEDDIEILNNPHLLSDLIDTMDTLLGREGWDVLFTDRDTKNTNGEYVPCISYALRPNFSPANAKIFQFHKNYSQGFRQIGARYGAYSMILRRSGMKKILDFIKTYHIFLPYDMDYSQPPGIRLFTVREDIVSTQPRAISDNGKPLYLNK